jgi:hypothetical protein
LIIVENSSEQTNDVASLIRKYREGFIIKHVLFERNITTNAFQCTIDEADIDFQSYEYITITDGDIVPDEGWLEETTDILQRRNEVFCCGLGLHLVNRPRSLPDAVLFPVPEIDKGDYLETRQADRAALAARIRRDHSFDVRAAEILRVIETLDAAKRTQWCRADLFVVPPDLSDRPGRPPGRRRWSVTPCHAQRRRRAGSEVSRFLRRKAVAS